MGISLLPANELLLFRNVIASLQSPDVNPYPGTARVGFSYAFIGNAPPTLAGVLLRCKNAFNHIPGTILFL
jgi:hypothetical protein